MCYTDHIALKRLPIKAKGRVTRWVERLMEYDIEVVHSPGRLHGLPDRLSRFPVEGENAFEQDGPVPMLCGVQERRTVRPDSLVRELFRRAGCDQCLDGVVKEVKGRVRIKGRCHRICSGQRPQTQHGRATGELGDAECRRCARLHSGSTSLLTDGFEAGVLPEWNRKEDRDPLTF